MRQIVFTSERTAELLDVPTPAEPLGPREIRGRTVVSLTSPGTELNWAYLGSSFPVHPGYACVFEVEECGLETGDIHPGALVFGQGNHAEFQRAMCDDVVPVPNGLNSEIAVFARLMAVSMSTLNTAAAHAPARVLVTGLGPVGNLAAQVFARCGYRVTAVDPIQSRRETALKTGLKDVRSGIGEAGAIPSESFSLHLECSGHEQAVLDGCRCVCKRGEVVLIGVPWKRHTDLTAAEILHAVFHRYIVLRSGWEWEIPKQPVDFAHHSIIDNYRAALDWLAEGSICVGPLAGSFAPSKAQDVYQGLLDRSLPTPTALFDWRLL